MKNYYYVNLGGMFPKVKKATEPVLNLSKHTVEISENEYNEYISRIFDEIPNID